MLHLDGPVLKLYISMAKRVTTLAHGEIHFDCRASSSLPTRAGAFSRRYQSMHTYNPGPICQFPVDHLRDHV